MTLSSQRLHGSLSALLLLATSAAFAACGDSATSTTGGGPATGGGGAGAGGEAGAGASGLGGSGGSEGGGGATGGAGGANVGGSGGAGGTNVGGSGGSGGGLSTLGEPCVEDTACASGACADGRCCDGACEGACESCDPAETGDVDGVCAPVMAGPVCRAAAGACDAEETCDGSSSECPADVLEPAGATASCAPYVCDGAQTSCPTSCDAVTDCAAGTVCVDGTCAAGKLAFVTSTSTTGAIGGVAGGDALCQSLAQASGLDGTFKAWLASGSESPASNFTQANVPYVRFDGVIVANDWADLVDGTVDAGLNRTESGATVNSVTWTGTLNSGAVHPLRCNDWTSADVATLGIVGDVGLLNAWAFAFNRTCDTLYPLYCFQQ